jgi:small-conductance mechanosensitive channel
MIRFIILCLLLITNVQAGIFDLIGFAPKKDTASEVFVTAYDKYSQQKTLLEQKLAATSKADDQLLAKRIERIAGVIQASKVRIKDAPIDDYDFLQKKIQYSSDIQQELIDLQIQRKTYQEYLEQAIKAIDVFLKNPDFSDLHVATKSSYQFQEYQDLSKQQLSLDEEADRLKEERRSLDEDLGKINRDIAQIEIEVKSKEKSQRQITQEKEGGQNRIFDVRQAGEILDVQKELLQTQKENKELRKKVIVLQLDMVDFKIFMNKAKTQIVQENLYAVEKGLYVNEVDLQVAEASYLQRKSEYQLELAQISQKITALTEQKERLNREFYKLNALIASPIKDVRLLTEWQIESSLLMAEPDVIKLGNINDAKLRLERDVALLNAKQDLVRVKLVSEDLSYKMLNSWYKMTHGKFKDDRMRLDEIAMYQMKEADLSRELLTIENHEGSTRSYMGSETRALSNIKRRLEDIQMQQVMLQEQLGAAVYKERFEKIKASEVAINKQLDLNGQILKTDSTIKATIKDLIKEIDQVVTILEKVGGIWQRSPDALSVEDIRLAKAEIIFFFQNLAAQLKQVNAKNIVAYLTPLKSFKKFLILFIFILCSAGLLSATNYLRRFFEDRILFSEDESFIRSLSAAILMFLIKHSRLFVGLFILYIAVFTRMLGTSTYLVRCLTELFYLGVFVYLARRFIVFVDEINEKYSYMLFNPTYEKRFMLIGSFLLYSVVILYFFKNAFVEIDLNTGSSLLPIVFSAIISIVIRTSLVLLISKQFLLGMLPLTHPIGYWLRDMIDSYYPFVLGVIVPMIMLSDPIIGGYAKLVSFVTWGLLYTAILIFSLLWLHGLIKRIAADIFFVEQDDAAKERFSYAKTTYGLFIVSTFALLLGIGVLIAASIWHQRLPYGRIMDILNFELFSVQGQQVAGTIQFVPFTVKSFVVLALFIVGGYLLAWLFERFVLDKLFTLFMVDAGVQNTASRISHYIIFVIVLFIAFQRVNLGALIPYGFGALLVAVAWALKGPANDFFAYFTILVERSVKIGDYISLNEEHGNVSGVVRKITPRTTVLRRRNSTTIIVPNSILTGASIINWNYTRGFFAFDDMTITVPFGSDAELTRKILLTILDQNKHILKNPSPVVRFEEIASNGYKFLVRGYLSSANVLNQWEITSEIRFQIIRLLKDAGIELATPIQTISIKQLPAGVRLESIHDDHQ